MKFLVRFLLILILLLWVVPVLAQEGEAPPSIGEQIDLWLVGASVALTFITTIVQTIWRYVFPDTVIKAGTIGAWVQGIAVIIFLAASAGGVLEQINAGVDVLSALAQPLTAIMILIFGPDVFRPAEERKVLGLSQSHRAFNLEDQQVF